MTLAPPRKRYAHRFAAAATEARPSEPAATWVAVPGGVVDGGEIILLAIKPSMWRPVFDSMPWMVVCTGLAIALTWLQRPLPGLSLATTAQVFLLLALARLAWAVVRWVPTWYLMTNRRLIEVHGVRAPRIRSCPLLEVRDTFVHVSVSERITGLGTITLITREDARSSHVWRSIHQVDEVHDAISRAIQNANQQTRFGI